MRRYLKFEILLPILAATVTAAVAVFRTLAICFAYDAEVGYYQSGNAYVILANLLSVLYIFLALGLSVVSCFGKLVPSRDPRPARLAAIALGCMLSLSCFETIKEGFGTSKTDICLLASLVCGILGISFCALTFLRVNTLEPLRAFGGLCLALSFLLHAIYHYLLTDLPINGDLKILYMFAALSASLFFLSEAKRSLSGENGVSARFFTLCCFLFCGSVGVSECFAFFFKKEAFSENYTHPLLLLFVGLYAFARLFAARVPVVTAEEHSDSLPASPSQTSEEEEETAEISTDAEKEAEAESAQVPADTGKEAKVEITDVPADTEKEAEQPDETSE